MSKRRDVEDAFFDDESPVRLTKRALRLLEEAETEADDERRSEEVEDLGDE